MPLLGSKAVKEPLRSRLLFPVTERAFTYAEYARWLDGLVDVCVVPLKELASTYGSASPVVALRHDVDERLDSALELARLEHERGLRATYFVLHTADYWHRLDLIDRLLELQALGHEVGWHNDLVTLQILGGRSPRETLARELKRLRGAGVDVVGTASHGSPWCHRLGYHNDYFFSDLPSPLAGFPNHERVGNVELEHGMMEEFGLRYDAYQLGEDRYLSDARFDQHGRRSHPGELDPRTLTPGTRTIVLIHPCHWDRSSIAKTQRLLAKVARRLRSRHVRAPRTARLR